MAAESDSSGEGQLFGLPRRKPGLSLRGRWLPAVAHAEVPLADIEEAYWWMVNGWDYTPNARHAAVCDQLGGDPDPHGDQAWMRLRPQ